MSIPFEAQITIPDNVLFRELDGEAVILSLDSERYYGLDEVGTRMWQLLTEHQAIPPAYAALLEEYDVAEAQLRHDLLELVQKLADEKLLVLH
jgi:hypothetical protein